jgi:mono/diheme cytochrome c family protein
MSDSLRKHRMPIPMHLPLLALASALLPAGFRAGAAEAPAVPTHPIVAGFERFFSEAKAGAVRGGQLLLGELKCVSCHQPATPVAAIARKQAPVLDRVGSRVRRTFLRKFLADPRAVKPGTTMPHLLAALPEEERRQKVEELVHFLASTGALKAERPDPKLVATGRELYHRAGCVACHGTRTSTGLPDRILPTSVPLGDLKAKYGPGSLAAFLADPLQVRPSGRMPGMLLNGQEAKALANYLLQGATFEPAQANLAYTYYEGNWQVLPDFDKLEPLAAGKADGFDVGVARRSNNMALRFEGYLRIDRDGDYRFHLTSDDGSKLFLDGKLVVANDGIHPPSTTSGAIKLTGGMHKLVAAVFNAGGGVELNVEVEGPGLGRQSAAPLIFLTPEGNPKKPGPNPERKDDETFALDPALVEKGRTSFAALGCAACHRLEMESRPIASRLAAPPLGKLKTEGGCLAENPAKGLPKYPLSAAQRSALAAAIEALAAPPAPAAPGEVIARTLLTFNCYACHQRDKVGGIEEAWNTSFVTAQPEMGDEGRVPPPLDGVGAKIATAWLNKILASGAKDRPYMLARMPKFGEANVGQLTRAFKAVDEMEPAPRPTFKQSLSQVKSEGRKMVGGNSLGCVKCHIFAGHKAEGVQGIDMTVMTQRLERDWFYNYLLAPQKLRPGTRMPESWPKGESLLPQVLGGSTPAQIEAIWLYLSDGTRARLPAGLNRTTIPLVPEKEAILYRNFIEGAGPRAIAVGYPEKAHLAFDANDLRLAMVWQGDFIDAARHWTDRGSGFQAPAGDNLLHLPAGAGFAVLAKDSEPWPAKHAKELGYHFRGYRLTPDQRPTFLYSVGEVAVEDFPNAVASRPAPSLHRTLTLKAKEPAAGLCLRAAVGNKIEALGDGWYRIDGEWRMRIESDAPPVVRDSAGKKELLVPVRFRDGKARIVQEFVW